MAQMKVVTNPTHGEGIDAGQACVCGSTSGSIAHLLQHLHGCLQGLGFAAGATLVDPPPSDGDHRGSW